MSTIIRIGTRDSELALWQANTVKDQLEKIGYTTQLIAVKSEGDLRLDQPLYELGITGIFTKTLDVALLNGSIDIAVHSFKDVPTLLPKGIVQSAVLKRANPGDLLVHKGIDFLNNKGVIATGSLRRKAQWLHRYPEHDVVDLRGNVNTRLQKLKDSHWNGAIFATAGLERIHLRPDDALYLDWMIPAPAQGAMMIATKEDNSFAIEATSQLNHAETEICTQIERDFLQTLEGGCTAPIGAIATIKQEVLSFEGALFALNGSEKVAITEDTNIKDIKGFGAACANIVLEKGGRALMQAIRKEMN